MARVLFVRNDGVFAIGHIDGAGQYVETQSGANFTTNWTHVVPVGSNILFARTDKLFAVGHIDGAGRYVETQKATTSPQIGPTL